MGLFEKLERQLQIFLENMRLKNIQKSQAFLAEQLGMTPQEYETFEETASAAAIRHVDNLEELCDCRDGSYRIIDNEDYTVRIYDSPEKAIRDLLKLRETEKSKSTKFRSKYQAYGPSEFYHSVGIWTEITLNLNNSSNHIIKLQ